MATQLRISFSIVLSISLLFSLQTELHAQQSIPFANPRPCGPATMPDWLLALIPQEFRGADFRSACRAHDACYGTTNEAKRQCDLSFRCHLMQACAESQRPLACSIRARTMYRAVAILGKPAFRVSQK